MVRVSSNLPSSWRVMIRSGGFPRQLNFLKNSCPCQTPAGFRLKDLIIQGCLLPPGLPVTFRHA